MEENKNIIGPARAVTGKPAKPVVERSRKRRLRGKGGPENEGCKFVGVRQRTWGKWVAEIREPNRGTRLWLGTFNTATDAAMAYDEAKRKLYGPCAKLNLPEPLGHQQRHSTSTSINSSNSDTAINAGTDATIAGDLTQSESSKMDLDGLMINHNDIMQGFGNWSKHYDDGFVGTSCANNNNDNNNHNFGVLFSGNEDEFMDYSTFGLQTPSSF